MKAIRQDAELIKQVADAINMKGSWATTIREVEQTAYDNGLGKLWTTDHTFAVIKHLIKLYDKSN